MALGHWAKDYLGPKEAGGGVKVVQITSEEMQITAQELLASITEGTLVVAFSAVGEYATTFEVVCYGGVDDQDRYIFETVSTDGNGSVAGYTWTASGPDKHPTPQI